VSEDSSWSLTFENDIAVIDQDDHRANAYTVEGLTRLNELLDTAQGSAGAVVLHGRPGYFSGGFDVRTIKEGGDRFDEMLALGARMFARLLTYPLPVVAACTGHALAAGSLVLLASDVRVGAAGDFKLGLHEVAILSPLPRFLIELARYRLPPIGIEGVLRGMIFDPESARDHGYLDVVVAPESVKETALREARQLMRLRRGVFAGAKFALRGDVAERMLSDLDGDLRLLNSPAEKATKARSQLSSSSAERERQPAPG
jgi:enoyl-CoA hydratase